MTTILNKNPAPEVMTKEFVIGYLRSNHTNSEELIDHFCNNSLTFYVHVLDGDEWGKRKMWIDGKNLDSTFCLEVYNMVENKDTVIFYADEFVIIDTIDYSKEIEALMRGRDFSITTLIKKIESCPDYKYIELIRSIFKLMPNYKKMGRGRVHVIE